MLTIVGFVTMTLSGTPATRLDPGPPRIEALAPHAAEPRVTPWSEGLPGEALEFQRRMIGPHCRQADPARADWLTTANPLRRPGEPPTWLAWSEGEVVGIQAGIAGELAIGPRRYPITWAVDLMVDPEHRGRGVASALVEAQHGTSRVQLAYGVTEGGAATLKRAGSVHVATASAYLFPCDARVVTAKAPGRVGAALARAAVAPVLAALGAVTRRAARRTHLAPIAEFGTGVDAIWDEVRSEYPVVVPRDSTWTRWRFDECPQRNEFERYEVVRGGRAVGYVVLRESEWQGQPVLEIVDYLVRRRHLRGLFARVAVLARRRSAAAVVCITLNRPARHQLRSIGFVNRKRAAELFRVMVNIDPADPLLHVLADPDALFLTCADGDVDE
jgi:GNAT superfamily N-acetyltransferase